MEQLISSSEGKRLHYLDNIRLVSISAMVLQHIIIFLLPSLLAYSGISYFLSATSLITAPVFLFSFGFLIEFRGKNNIEILRRGVFLFSLGFLVNLASNPDVYFKSALLFFSESNILHVAGLYGIYRGLYRKVNIRYYIISFSFIFIILIASNILDLKLPFLTGKTDRFYTPFSPWAIYVLLGSYLFYNPKSLKPLHGAIISAFSIPLFLFPIIYTYAIHFFEIGFLIIFIGVLRTVSNRYCFISYHVSKNVTFIYIIHFLLFRWIAFIIHDSMLFS